MTCSSCAALQRELDAERARTATAERRVRFELGLRIVQLYEHRATLLDLEDEGGVVRRQLAAINSKIDEAERSEREYQPTQPASVADGGKEKGR